MICSRELKIEKRLEAWYEHPEDVKVRQKKTEQLPPEERTNKNEIHFGENDIDELQTSTKLGPHRNKGGRV